MPIITCKDIISFSFEPTQENVVAIAQRISKLLKRTKFDYKFGRRER